MSNLMGGRIKARRMAMQMSQTELAHKLGYADRSMIAKIEAGNIKDLPISKIEKLCEVLEITYDYATGKALNYKEERDQIVDTSETMVLNYGDELSDKIIAIVSSLQKYKDIILLLDELPAEKVKLVKELIKNLS